MANSSLNKQAVLALFGTKDGTKLLQWLDPCCTTFCESVSGCTENPFAIPISQVVYGTGIGVTSDAAFTRNSITGEFEVSQNINSYTAGLSISTNLLGSGIPGIATYYGLNDGSIDAISTEGDLTNFGITGTGTYSTVVDNNNNSAGTYNIKNLTSGLFTSSNQVTNGNIVGSYTNNINGLMYIFTDGTHTSVIDAQANEVAISYASSPTGTQSGVRGTDIGSGNTGLDFSSNGIIWSWPRGNGPIGSVPTTTAASGGLLVMQPPVLSGITGAEPSSPYLGQFYFDSTLVKMKFWNGTVWAIITSTP